MVEQTPRLDLDTYSEGESWDHTDTVEAVDEHSIVHGPISERPSEGEYDDELYHATDQNITWRWDSSASDWEYFSGQGSSTQSVPGTSHFEAASIEDVDIGDDVPYHLISNSHTTVTVNSGGGADYNSIQAAVDDAPKYLRHEHVIDVQDSHDESVGGDGHVHIEAVHHVNSADGSEGFTVNGDHGLLRIQGNRSDPSQCKVDTLAAFGCTGVQSPTLLGLEFSGDPNPDVDEDVCVSIDGCTEGFFADCTVLSGTARSGMQFYKSGGHVRDCEINSDWAFANKRGSDFHVHNLSGSYNRASGMSTSSVLRADSSVGFPDIEWPGTNPSGEAFFRSQGGIGFQRGWASWNPNNLTFVHDTDSSDGAFQFRDFNADVMRFKIDGKGWGNEHIEDLSGQTGDFDGQVRLDDGTNVANRGIPCTWNDAGSEWVPHDGSATFS